MFRQAGAHKDAGLAAVREIRRCRLIAFDDVVFPGHWIVLSNNFQAVKILADL